MFRSACVVCATKSSVSISPRSGFGRLRSRAGSSQRLQVVSDFSNGMDRRDRAAARLTGDVPDAHDALSAVSTAAARAGAVA